MSSQISTKKETVWKIPNLSKELFTSDQTQGDISSKRFLVIIDDQYTEWYLRFRPIKSNCEFYLRLVSCSTHDFTANFSADLVNSIKEKKISYSFEKVGKDFLPTPSWGWPAFVLGDRLLQDFDNFVVNGTLTFSCVLSVTLLPLSEEKSSRQSCLAPYKDLFDEKTLSDFKIVSNDGKNFNVHKVVLAANSEIFKAMLTTDMKESRAGICRIDGFDSKIIDAMLKFIYSRETSGLDEIARDLIYAAEKYQLIKLKDFCIKSIIKTLKAENVVEALKISTDFPGNEVLYKKCAAVVLNNWDEIVKTKKLKNLSKEMLLDLYELHVNALRTVVNL